MMTSSDSSNRLLATYFSIFWYWTILKEDLKSENDPINEEYLNPISYGVSNSVAPRSPLDLKEPTILDPKLLYINYQKYILSLHTEIWKKFFKNLAGFQDFKIFKN